MAAYRWWLPSVHDKKYTSLGWLDTTPIADGASCRVQYDERSALASKPSVRCAVLGAVSLISRRRAHDCGDTQSL